MNLVEIVVPLDAIVRVGDSVVVCITDIDPNGIRLIAEGTLLGGPEDGMPFRVTREMRVGSLIDFGDLVRLHLRGIQAGEAILGVDAPKHFPVSVRPT